MRDSTIIYRSFYEAVRELPPHNQAEVWTAIFEYSLNRTVVDLSGLSKTIFRLIKPQLDANLKRYENGLKPKKKQTGSKTEAKSELAGSVPVANENVNVNENENPTVDIFGHVPIKRFVPPTLVEWTWFFTSNGYKRDVAETSWKSYDVAEWKDSNGKPIKNWKQKAIQVWFKDPNKQDVASVATDKVKYTLPSNYRPTK
jgi:hypothetical protein